MAHAHNLRPWKMGAKESGVQVIPGSSKLVPVYRRVCLKETKQPPQNKRAHDPEQKHSAYQAKKKKRVEH